MAKRRVESKVKKRTVVKQQRSAKNNGTGRSNRVAATPPPQDCPAADGAAVPCAPMPKTRLKPNTLESFKLLLLEKRRQLLGDVNHMEDEALKKNRTDAAGDLSMMPIHMADIGTDAYEQEFTIGLIENEKEILKEIDAALGRIKNRTFGICQATRKPIRKSRLQAKPWARYCVEYRRSQEENGR